MRTKYTKEGFMKYYCYECEKESIIKEEDLIPHRGWDYFTEEFLLFYAICPKCKKVGIYEECLGNEKILDW